MRNCFLSNRFSGVNNCDGGLGHSAMVILACDWVCNYRNNYGYPTLEKVNKGGQDSPMGAKWPTWSIGIPNVKSEVANSHPMSSETKEIIPGRKKATNTQLIRGRIWRPNIAGEKGIR